MELTTLAPGKFYLDANVFIYAIEANPTFVEQVTALFEHIAGTESSAITSELTLAECLVKPFTDQDEQSQLQYESHIRSSELLQVMPVSRQVLVDAARLRANHKNKLPDTIHLVTALSQKCSYFVTNDAKIRFPSEITPIIIGEIT